jgi:hypothetical protein
VATVVRRLGVVVAALALGACGSSATHSSGSPSSATTSSSSTTTAAAGPAPAVDELAAAQRPVASQFPSSSGKSLQQLAKLAGSAASLGAANGTFTPGFRRLAFALTNNQQRFIYAPTAVYVAPTPSSPARGPFLAPADPMTVQPQYRSQQNAAPGGLQAIYSTNVPASKAQTYDVLSLTKTSKGLIGATGEIAVAKTSPIPDVGQRPPAIATDTLATVHGNVSLLTTRVPPESMHSASFNQLLGKKPIVLIFSTPELCHSRICGPVTDVAVQLQHEFGNRIVFIHQEVYADNNPSKGLRPQMKAFHLQTEPWVFTINRQGIIAARLEGAFGLDELRQAIDAALK